MKQTLLATALLTSAVAFSQNGGKTQVEWLSQASAAQTESNFLYVFQQSSQAYQGLSNPDFSLVGGGWDDPYIAVANPFGVQWLGFSIDSLGMDWGSSMIGFGSTNEEVYIAPMSVDLIDRSSLGGPASSIHYVTEGTAGNGIFKMEWEDAGFYAEYDSLNSTNDYANIQLWLYEDETIEFRFGANSVSTATLTALVNWQEMICGFAGWDGMSVQHVHVLNGSASNPTLTNSFMTSQLTSWPADGTVYTFTLASIGVDEMEQIDVKLYPNPATTELRIRTADNESYNVQLIDVTGRVVRTGMLSNDRVLSLNGIQPGIYMARLNAVQGGESKTIRLVVR